MGNDATEKVKDIGGDVMKGDFSSIKQMGACATKFTKDSCNTYTEHDCYWNKPDGTLSKTVLKMHPAGGFVKGVCAAWERTEGCAYDTEDKCIRDDACMYSGDACKSAGLFGLGFELWMWGAALGALVILAGVTYWYCCCGDDEEKVLDQQAPATQHTAIQMGAVNAAVCSRCGCQI